MINFKKRSRKPEHFYNDSGSDIRTLYILDGDHLIEAGSEDSQAIMDSYRDSTDLNLILERISQEELDRLVNSRSVFMDTTAFPQSLADLKNSYNNSVDMYNSLPDDIKSELGGLSKFGKMSDSDFEAWILKHSVRPEIVESEVSE